MSRPSASVFIVALLAAIALLSGFTHDKAFWPQWGRDAQHTGKVDVAAQPLNRKLTDIVYDPFTQQEKRENFPLYQQAILTAHFQSTLVDGESFYMMQKSGTYPSCTPNLLWLEGGACGPNAWGQLQWNVVRYDWKKDTAVAAWTYWTDWKPEPNGTNLLQGDAGLQAWEPVFHPALANGYLYVPGAGGTVWKVDTRHGSTVSQINPFAGSTVDPASTFVSSPLTPDDRGNLYYNVVELNLNGNPWNQNDVAGAWLVKVTSGDKSSTVSYTVLVPNAPPGTSTNCEGSFFNLGDQGASLPWPPTPTSVAPAQLCGSQRAPLNLAPAVAPDGTVYTVSAAHFDDQVAYLVAVNPDLTPKWASSLQYRLTDGCGVLLPIAAPGVLTEPSSCRNGTTMGVDPATNAKGSGYASDLASSTPTVLPDGSILFGTQDDYDYGRGHLFHFDQKGNFVNSYPFGWDSTPAVFRHDGTFSVVIKDNHYAGGAYCNFPGNPVCTPAGPGPYYVTQLDSNLKVEWSFQNTTIDANHPNGYEWCVNAPVIDANGVVYATSEDGHVYSIAQGHTGVFTQWKQKIFLLEALGAAYTPLAIGDDGKVYTQNNGHLFVVGK